jgi:hypothetical protein
MNLMDWHPELHNQTPAIEVISLLSLPRPCNARAWEAPMNKLVMTNIHTHLFSEVAP